MFLEESRTIIERIQEVGEVLSIKGLLWWSSHDLAFHIFTDLSGAQGCAFVLEANLEGAPLWRGPSYLCVHTKNGSDASIAREALHGKQECRETELGQTAILTCF